MFSRDSYYMGGSEEDRSKRLEVLEATFHVIVGDLQKLHRGELFKFVSFVNPTLSPSVVDSIIAKTFGADEYFTLETFVSWLDRVTQDFNHDRFDRVVRRMVKYHAHRFRF
jgi:hypothetical protein